MFHEDSQPLVIWVNIYVNVVQISKLTHRQVVFVKKITKFGCIFFFFCLFSLKAYKSCFPDMSSVDIDPEK